MYFDTFIKLSLIVLKYYYNDCNKMKIINCIIQNIYSTIYINHKSVQ